MILMPTIPHLCQLKILVTTPDGMTFETMVFDTTVDDEVDSRRYTTSAEAVCGHAAFIQEIQLIEDALTP